MILYHGTSQDFETFQYKHIGKNGTSKGYGFYFTNDIREAESYAVKDCQVYGGTPRVMTCRVDLLNSASLEVVTLNTGQIRRLLLSVKPLILRCYGSIH